MKKELTILELFAGVGGFRIGLETANKNYYKTLWSNQWEPSRKAQDAFNCYDNHFPESENLNEDISTISDERFANINADMIVGGFPCQDYSVARSLSGGMGIQGKKGVLFWEIIRATKIIQPTFLLLENVDRLLKSPASQRGRDFAIMLAAFNDLGYSVEWRVINAAEYGLAQKRRRVFIFVYKNKSDFAKKVQNYSDEEIIYNDGLFARGFPIENKPYKNRFVSDIISEDIVSVSDNFSSSIFNTGIMRNGKFTSIETVPVSEKPIPLKDILQPESEVNDKYYLNEDDILKFKTLRGAKKIQRISADGHMYTFSEGSMSETDDIDKPGRTMLTSEGSKNRSTHLIKIDDKYRILTPLECEALNGFPPNWTANMPDRMRYFCMGNALVTGVIERIGKQLYAMNCE
ncbi:DNA (cytosine-5-)-methyltransferase [Listeria monocytogenes]|uniref:Cytosine-specific methyltransferase n=2 Tax=Listeria TaxID=1637 RepID=A0AAN2WPM2_LISMN|nr:DNA (cytosine-5-)-methyltransferase [Listeria monocytogenes]EAA0164226.1 DNA (cytosine-5-)-methyltransferase [Listeria monocytogenes serotype 1/2a]EAG6360920.1 DNA (cytosine-5-)-methyltransferase [Listeria monocytogenes CFSAN002351]EHC6202923.1 DNA (cytosine-5-)-methyltransferase [Listeria monocytogenes serotype 1/2c]AKG84484.1 modification methylase [Listeria monocytogenes]AKI48276.1 DNA methylase, C-5 cytosine-specific [Listeria monocytogenes]